MYTQCPKCSEVFEVDAEFTGQRVDCTECGENFEIREAVGQKCPYCGKRAEPEKEGTVVNCSCGNAWTVGTMFAEPSYAEIKKNKIRWIVPPPDARQYGEKPITDRQLEFLLELGLDETEELHRTSCKWASYLIDKMISLRNRAVYGDMLEVVHGINWSREQRRAKRAEVEAEYTREIVEINLQKKIEKAEAAGKRICRKCGRIAAKAATVCAKCGEPLDPPGGEA